MQPAASLQSQPAPPFPKKGLKWLGAAGLFGLAFLIRLAYAVQLHFPPLDDPAYYVQAARSFFTPHAGEVSIIWNFQPRFSTLLHPALDYWQPLPAFAIALSFWLFGQSLLAAQLPSLLAGALLPLFTFWLGGRVFGSLVKPKDAFWLSLAAGGYVAINPLLVYQATAPDSSMLYAALVAGALWLWDGGQNRSGGQAVGFGLLTGLAYLARTPAVFLGLAWFVWFITQKPFNWRNFGWVILGIGLPVGLWSVRNLLTFGFITSPAGLQTVFISDYQSLFNFQTPINLNTFMSSGIGNIVSVRLEALSNVWFGVLDPLLFPTALPAVVGLVLLARKMGVARLGALYSLFLGLGLPLIFGVASTNGSYYHSVGSSAPYLAVGLAYLLWLIAEWVKSRRLLRIKVLPALGLLIFSLTMLKFVISYNATIAGQNSEGETFQQIGTWLQQHPANAVITNEPSSLNYATGVPSVRLPAAENLDVLAQVAAFYHANYIIITESAGQYPALLQSSPNGRFPLVYRAPNDIFEIYGVR